jgi:hypothetical protein
MQILSQPSLIHFEAKVLGLTLAPPLRLSRRAEREPLAKAYARLPLPLTARAGGDCAHPVSPLRLARPAAPGQQASERRKRRGAPETICDERVSEARQVTGVMTPEPNGSPANEAFGESLRSCQGFRVDGPQGRIGHVRAVRLDSSGRAEVLEVRAGLRGRRTLLIPVSEIADVIPEQRRLVLRANPRLLASDPSS